MYLASTSSEQPGPPSQDAASSAEARLQQVKLPPSLPPPKPPESPRPERLHAAGRWLRHELSRPRVRLCVVGVLLLLLAAFVVDSSMWTLPLVVVGALMVLIAWIGSRLDGRFAVEWGEGGTQLEFRAQIKSPHAPGSSALPPASATPESRPAAREEPQPDPAPEDAEIIEGEAQTVEIDVAELKALLAAAEAEEIRVARAAAEARTPPPG
jgi:hypothetical protein